MTRPDATRQDMNNKYYRVVYTNIGRETVEPILVVSLTPHNQQVLPFFPQLDPDEPEEGTILDYAKPDNQVGHQQRCWLNAWAIKAFAESGGIPGLECGSAGVPTFGCLNTDVLTHGSQGEKLNIQQQLNASEPLPYADNAFSSIVSSHLIEHLPCNRHYVSQRARYRQPCPGTEIISILQEWVRVIRPGGYLACILPDDKYPREAGSSSLFHDPTHQHAWTADEFLYSIILQLENVEIVEYNTLNNKFSLCFLLKKAMGARPQFGDDAWRDMVQDSIRQRNLKAN